MKTILLAFNFNLNTHLSQMSAFNNKKIEEQVKELRLAIRATYEIANKNNPKSRIILAWREFAINALGEGRIALADKEKQAFITAMYEESNHENFTIIAGTVATFKEKSDKTPLSDRYIMHKYLEKNDADKQFADHKKELDNLSDKEFNQIRNTCYIFSEGKKVGKRDKIAPYNETKNNKQVKNPIFRPGKTFDVISVADQKLLISICREIGAIDTSSSADIHFILSASVSLLKKRMRGRILVHIDSTQPLTAFVKNPNDKKDFAIYSVDILSDLTSPIFTQVEIEMLDIFSLIQLGEKNGFISLLQDKNNAAKLLVSTQAGITPLVAALQFGYIDFVKIILNSDAFETKMLMIQDQHGSTPLMIAIAHQRINCINAVMTCPAMTMDVLQVTDNLGHDVVDFILKSPLFIGKTFLDNPLFLSLGFANLLWRTLHGPDNNEFLTELLQHNDFQEKDFLQQDNGFKNVLHFTVGKTKQKLFKTLINSPHCTDNLFHQQNNKGNNLLHLTIKYNNETSFNVVLENKYCTAQSLAQQNMAGKNALHCAISEQLPEFAIIILSSKHISSELFTQQDKKERNVLHLALTKNKINLLALMLDSKHLPSEALMQTNQFNNNVLQEILGNGEWDLIYKIIEKRLCKSNYWMTTKGPSKHALAMIMKLVIFEPYAVIIKKLVEEKQCDKAMLEFIKNHKNAVHVGNNIRLAIEKQLLEKSTYSSGNLAFFTSSLEIDLSSVSEANSSNTL